MFVAALLGVGVVATGLAVRDWRSLSGAAGTSVRGSAPMEGRIEGDRSKVFDARKALLGEHSLPSGLGQGQSDYNSTKPRDLSVLVEDLDGDAAREVVFLQRGPSRDDRRLHVFNRDGSTRFAHQPTSPIRFGETTYDPPWLAQFLAATRRGDGVATLWVGFVHGMWFPTRLQRLDAQGTVRSEYWSNGYVTFMQTATWRGRPAMLVGATNNEHRSASLAIFEGEQVEGSAPAANPRYRCADCPPGRPAAFIVFPGLCAARVDDGQPFVEQAWVDGAGRLVVGVNQGKGVRPSGDVWSANVFYTLDTDLRPTRVEFTREFHSLHALLERRGLLDHPLGEVDRKALFPLLLWQDEGWLPLPPAPVVE